MLSIMLIYGWMRGKELIRVYVFQVSLLVKWAMAPSGVLADEVTVVTA